MNVLSTRLVRRALSLALGFSLSSCLFPVFADDVVSDCDQESLENAIASGGTITFDCDGTIVLTNTIFITDDIVLDATGHSITISSPGGTNGLRLFTIDQEFSLTLINVKLADGVSTNGGAIYVDTNAFLVATSCVFSNNVALGTNGVTGASARIDLSEANGHDGRNGTAGSSAAGGAIYNLGFTCLTACTFLTNAVIGGTGGDGGDGGTGSFTGGDGGSGGRGGAAVGGAIDNLNELAITNSTFLDNQAVGGFGGQGGGGGSAPFGGDNGRGGGGGATAGAAIFNHKGTLASIVSSTFALNGTSSGDGSSAGSGRGTAQRGAAGPDSSGGAIANLGTNDLINCTFFANAAVGGGGGAGGASTFRGGKGGAGGTAWGGNVFNGGKTARMFATNCTFSDGGAIGGTNGAGGAGPFAGAAGKKGASRGGNIAGSNGFFFIKNCLIAYPSSGTNGYGKLKDAGFNLSSDRSIKLDLHLSKTNRKVNLNPKLDILRDNGGPVQTLELLEGSPAIDAGDTNFCLDTDARGVARPGGARCDIGAYETGQRLLAPVIVVSPADKVVQPGGSVTFRVVATGDPPLRYQWRFGAGDDIDDATNTTYTVASAGSGDEGDYEVVVSNNSGSTTSPAATLSVIELPTVTEDPESVTVNVGEGFTLTVAADGDEPLRYRWLTNDVAIPGAVSTTYTVAFAQAKDDAEYRVEVCNPVGCVLSEAARVTVLPSAPIIVVQPADQAVAPGSSATFAVQVAGSPPLSYYWRKGNVPVLTETNLLRTTSSLLIPNAQLSSTGAFQVVISNAFGTATSAIVNLYVQTVAPAITTQPVGATVTEGTAYTLSVAATGSAPLRYQWRVNNSALAGATASSLVFTNIRGADAGSYSVTVANALGAVTSVVAVLNVDLIPPTIVQQPADIAGYFGDTVVFQPMINGSLLSYQWFFNNTTLLAGATNATLTLTNAQAANIGSYLAVVTNVAGAVTTAPAALVLSSSLPIITGQPFSVSNNVGSNLTSTLSVSVAGSKPFFYQWFFNDAPLFAPTNSTFAITNPASGSLLRVTNGPAGSTLTVVGIKTGDEGVYGVRITNSVGAVRSDDALLDVLGFGVGN